MKIIRRWHAREFHLAGEPLRVKLKALQKSEAPEFLKGIAELGRGSGIPKTGDVMPEGRLDELSEMLCRLDSVFVRKCFREYVKPDEEMATEDGTKIESGEQLYEEASPGFITAVLMELQRLCVLTAREGKDSPSRSGSSAAAGTGNGSSAATSTASADGPAPSGATETTGVESSSSVLAPA